VNVPTATAPNATAKTAEPINALATAANARNAIAVRFMEGW
jgi:hypothetical protein